MFLRKSNKTWFPKLHFTNNVLLILEVVFVSYLHTCVFYTLYLLHLSLVALMQELNENRFYATALD